MTWGPDAVIHIDLAVLAGKSWFACAGVGSHSVLACSAVLTRVRIALVNIRLAIRTAIANNTLAGVGRDIVRAATAI